VTLCFHFGEDVLDLAIRANDECGPGDAHYLLPIQVLFLQNAEGIGDYLVGVGEQAERKVVLVLKFLLRLRRVGRDPENYRTGLLNLLIGVAEPASFYGSTGSIGAREEIQDHSLAAEFLKRNIFSVLVLQSEVGSFIMDVHGNLFLILTAIIRGAVGPGAIRS
jgi:hypothetical protein